MKYYDLGLNIGLQYIASAPRQLNLQSRDASSLSINFHLLKFPLPLLV
jgi:hypothetical protein